MTRKRAREVEGEEDGSESETEVEVSDEELTARVMQTRRTKEDTPRTPRARTAIVAPSRPDNSAEGSFTIGGTRSPTRRTELMTEGAAQAAAPTMDARPPDAQQPHHLISPSEAAQVINPDPDPSSSSEDEEDPAPLHAETSAAQASSARAASTGPFFCSLPTPPHTPRLPYLPRTLGQRIP